LRFVPAVLLSLALAALILGQAVGQSIIYQCFLVFCLGCLAACVFADRIRRSKGLASRWERWVWRVSLVLAVIISLFWILSFAGHFRFAFWNQEIPR